MSFPARTEIVERLVRELGYPENGAEVMADKIAALNPLLREAFEHWWREGELREVEVEGYTPQRLITENGLTPIAALVTLDWLSREPDAARATIARGHDRVQLPVSPPRMDDSSEPLIG